MSNMDYFAKYRRMLVETFDLHKHASYDFNIWDALHEAGVTDDCISEQRHTCIPVLMSREELTKLRLRHAFITVYEDDSHDGPST